MKTDNKFELTIAIGIGILAVTLFRLMIETSTGGELKPLHVLGISILFMTSACLTLKYLANKIKEAIKDVMIWIEKKEK